MVCKAGRVTMSDSENTPAMPIKAEPCVNLTMKDLTDEDLSDALTEACNRFRETGMIGDGWYLVREYVRRNSAR